ncbi:MAG: radical SAM protein [Deltaproteobacteria bacterium]|nr:radical SAM protein [Deltaproteobacteria bacterium]
MRVAFLQKDPLPDPYVAVVAAQAVFRGHSARVFLPGAERDVVGAVRRFAPGLLVVHVAGGFVDWARATGAALSRALGGPPVCFIGEFPSSHPELALLDGVDFVLPGDPDETVSELLWRISLEKTLRGCMGTVGVHEGALDAGPPREPVGDLDETPAADFEIYRRYRFVQDQKTAPILLGRGTVENLHAGFRIGAAELRRRFAPARKHSVQGAISRVQMMKQRRPFYTRFGFRDDSVCGDHAWLAAFLERYTVEVELPFGCMARPDQLPPRVIDQLADAGCDTVRLGIESGDPELRQQVAGTAIPDEQVEAVVARLRERGIRVQTVSFLGVPGETPDSAVRTVELVARLRPDHAFCFTLWDDPDAVTSPELQRLAWLVPYAAQMPWLEKAVVSAMSQTADGLFERLFRLQHDVGFVRSGELPLGDMTRMALRMSRTRQWI